MHSEQQYNNLNNKDLFLTVNTLLKPSILAVCLTLTSVFIASPAYSWFWDLEEKQARYLATNTEHKDYQYECGACHIAYPAQLMPKRSWVKLIASLDDHFGEDATPDKVSADTLLIHLSANASDSDNAGKFRDFLKQIQSPAPYRITDLRFWRLKHDKVIQQQDDWVVNNPDVGSFTQCNACHEKAEQGEFDKQTVDIPNIQRELYAR